MAVRRAALLLGLSVALQEPDCYFEGRAYSGDRSDYDDITNLCPAALTSTDFSILFWANWDGWQKSRAFAFFKAGDDMEVWCGPWRNAFYCQSRQRNATGYYKSLSSVSKWYPQEENHGYGKWRQYLFTVTNGRARMVIDGVQHYSGTRKFDWTPHARTLWVGRGSNTNYPMKGSLTNLSIWHSEISQFAVWTTTSSTTTPTTTSATTSTTSTVTATTTTATTVTKTTTTSTTVTVTTVTTTVTTTTATTSTATTSTATTMTATTTTATTTTVTRTTTTVSTQTTTSATITTRTVTETETDTTTITDTTTTKTKTTTTKRAVVNTGNSDTGNNGNEGNNGDNGDKGNNGNDGNNGKSPTPAGEDPGPTKAPSPTPPEETTPRPTPTPSPTPPPTPPPPSPAPGVSPEVISLEKQTLDELIRTGGSVMKKKGKVTVLAKMVGSLEGSTPVQIGGGSGEPAGVFVKVPPSALTKAGLTRGAAVATFLDADEIQPTTEADGSTTTVKSATNVNIFDLSGGAVDVSGLTEPVEIGLGAVGSAADCAYWHETEGKFKTDGMTAVRDADGNLSCKATHLTFFAAILKGFLATFECAQLGFLTEEGMKALITGNWFISGFAIMWWIVTILLCAGCARSYIQDKKDQSWTDEYFLIPLDKEDAPLREAEPAKKEISSCSVFPAAVADIVSRWCQGIKGMFGGLCGGKKEDKPVDETKAKGVAGVAHGVLGTLLTGNARFQASTTLGLSPDVVKFILEDKDLGNLLRNTAGSKIVKASDDPWEKKVQAWHQLHDMVLQKVNEHWNETGWGNLGQVVGKLFLKATPTGTIFTGFGHGLLPHGMRMLFFTSKLLGALFVAAVFFQGAGMANNAVNTDARCSKDLDIGEAIGRLIAVSIASFILATIPSLILTSLHKRGFKKVTGNDGARQLAIWRCQDQILWGFGIIYCLWCGFFITLFLANVDPLDIPQWGVTTIITVIKQNVLIPMAVAFFVPGLAAASLSMLSWAKGAAPLDLLKEHREKRGKKGGNWDPVIVDI